MSRTIRYFAIAAFAASISTVSAAADKPAPATYSPTKWATAEKNYIRALDSENDGVRTSAAGFLGLYQLRGSIDALIRTLQTDKSEVVRCAAAAALIQMHDARGEEAVEEASLYDGSDKVASYCARILTEEDVPAYTVNADE